MRPVEVGREVAVAQAEPRQPAVPLQRVHHRPRLVDQTPARLRVDGTGECVDDGVDVGADVQAVQRHVVTGVHHHGDVRRVAHLDQAPQEAGGADASGQCGDHPAQATARLKRGLRPLRRSLTNSRGNHDRNG